MLVRSCLACFLFAGIALPPVTLGAEPAVPSPGEQIATLSPTGTVQLQVGRQKLLRTRAKVQRTAVADSSICDVAAFAAREISVLGRAAGETQVTFWFDDPTLAPLTWVVEVK